MADKITMARIAAELKFIRAKYLSMLGKAAGDRGIADRDWVNEAGFDDDDMMFKWEVTNISPNTGVAFVDGEGINRVLHVGSSAITVNGKNKGMQKLVDRGLITIEAVAE